MAIRISAISKPIWFLMVFLSLMSSLHAQQVSVSTKPLTAADAPQGLIRLDVTAMDASGMPIVGLTPKDFTLLDNGQQRQILSFHAYDKSGPPTQVILLLDVLGVQPAMAAQIRRSAIGYLRSDSGHLSRTISIFQLSAEGFSRIGSPSDDGNALAVEVERNHQIIIQPAFQQDSSFRGLPQQERVPIGSVVPTATAGLRAFGQIAIEQRRKPGKKLILWIGPGFGDGTGAYSWAVNYPMSKEERGRLLYTANWLSTLLRDARIVLDVFSIGQAEPVNLPVNRYTSYLDGPKSAKDVSWVHLYKKVVAIQSGGQAYEPSDDIVDKMKACVRGADAFYSISFDPARTDHPGDYHALTIQIGKPDITARTRSGYFDEPYYTDQAKATAKPVSIQQLEQTLRDSHGKRDGDVALSLAQLRLTERLDGAKLATLAAGLSGDKARQQLTMLADASTFLDSPSAEMPSDPAPHESTQRQMISAALDAVSATISKLPNVIATRSTIRYLESPQFIPAMFTEITQPLHKADSSTLTVAFRRGGEVQEGGATPLQKLKPDESSLTLTGTFGPALTAAVDILSRPDSIAWKSWGQDAVRRRAVFSFSLPAAGLSVVTGGCCLPDDEGTTAFPRLLTYSGEIEIDPASGALLRLEIKADPKSTIPLLRADTMIEYGPVDIGAKTYICPLRSIALTRERSIRMFTMWDEGFKTYGPFITLLNDISFSNYHVFRAQSRILPNIAPTP